MFRLYDGGRFRARVSFRLGLRDRVGNEIRVTIRAEIEEVFGPSLLEVGWVSSACLDEVGDHGKVFCGHVKH